MGGLCPAVRTLDQCLRSAIPFFNGQFTDAGINKQTGKHIVSQRLQTTGNPRHQMGVCLDILLFAEPWAFDTSVDSSSEVVLGENLVKTFIDLKDAMKWTEIIYEDRLFWEPEYYKHYGQDRKHFTHIHIDWMTNSLKGKGKSEEEIISNSPQANTTSFSAALLPRLSKINEDWTAGRLSRINLAGIVKSYKPEENPVGDWNVVMDRWRWIYTFNADGSVKWRDPYNNETGNGTWRIEAGAIKFVWAGSTTVESWTLPINPAGQTGTAIMKGKHYTLNATRL